MQLSYHEVTALELEEMLLVAILRRAIRDTKESRCEKMRAEASAWLWDVAAVEAKRAGVPNHVRYNAATLPWA
jgi:hypothetical protein